MLLGTNNICTLDKKQKEALVLAMLEKGESYREIAQKAKVSPNTIKAISNRAGLDETTSITSRVFELYSQDKTPLEVAIALGLKADDAINLHREYFKLLGCTEFTKVYLQIKDNPWAYVNLVRLAQESRMSDEDVVELLKIAKAHLPRVRLEYDRLKAELNSLEDENRNSAKEQQRLCDEISEMRTIVDQLQLSIRESRDENSKLELQKIKLQKFVKNFQDNNTEYNKAKQAIKGQLEYILADRRHLIEMAVQAVIEILRADPQKFHTFYYNQSTVQPANNEDPLLVETGQVYERMLENNTNKVVTTVIDNISPMSIFGQKELCGEQAFHPDFVTIKNNSNNTNNALNDNSATQI
jgi:hypothetical protein